MEKPDFFLTRRFRLQPATLADTPSFGELWNLAGVRRFLFDDEPVSLEWVGNELQRNEQTLAEKGYGLWKVVFRNNPASLIGFAGFRHFFDPPELQLLYGVHPDWWGNNIAPEVAQAVIQVGFDLLQFDQIVASADAPNQASFRVMEKVGMRFQKKLIIDGKETIFYELNRAAFTPDLEFRHLNQPLYRET